MKPMNLLCALPILLAVSVYAVNSNAEDDTGYERTGLAVKADELFWKLLHGQDYGSFAKVLEKLNKARNADPNDVMTAAHIGWTNFWGFAEGLAGGWSDGTQVLQYMQDSVEAFASASTLAPDEARIMGFLGYARTVLGGASGNLDILRQGQADIKRSLDLWPQWALFGAAYGLDARSLYDSSDMQRAIGYYFQGMDICLGQDVDRNNPDISQYAATKTLTGPNRICWNSWIVPYNDEGFYMVLGDALVKAGQTAVAAIVYNDAKLSDGYAHWPFRDMLERRITNIDANVENFRRINPPGQPADPETSLLVYTNVSCAICHRGDSDKYFERPPWVGEHANDYLVVPY